MLGKVKIAFFLFLVSFTAAGQDVQLSQYYNTPLYLNPAFTGTANNTRAIFNYRNQWTALPVSYQTFTASFDHFVAPHSSGVGLLIQSDRQGDGKLQSTSANLLYSYHVWLSEKYTFIPALQLGFTNRSVNYANYIFGDQLSFTNTPISSSDPIQGSPSVNYLDVGAGGLFYSDKLWLGLSSYHLNTPNQGMLGTSKLPIKLSVHGGYKFFLKSSNYPKSYKGYKKERSIIPTFLYKKQGAFDQLDLGIYSIYDPLMFGMWYRGIPVKKYSEGINNHEALIFMVGLYHNGFNVCYSYDLTISTFRMGTGGSHEITIGYQFEIPYPKSSIKKHPRKVSCPTFYK